MGDVNRMTHFNVPYSIGDLGDGTVELLVKVPFWLIKSAFPDAPAKALKSFAKLAKE
ncbi:hypothetical protein ACFLTA_06745 [Bacteroidota bacterium]